MPSPEVRCQWLDDEDNKECEGVTSHTCLMVVKIWWCFFLKSIDVCFHGQSPASVIISDRLYHCLHGFIYILLIIIIYIYYALFFWMVNGERKFWEAPSTVMRNINSDERLYKGLKFDVRLDFFGGSFLLLFQFPKNGHLVL